MLNIRHSEKARTSNDRLKDLGRKVWAHLSPSPKLEAPAEGRQAQGIDPSCLNSVSSSYFARMQPSPPGVFADAHEWKAYGCPHDCTKRIREPPSAPVCALRASILPMVGVLSYCASKGSTEIGSPVYHCEVPSHSIRCHNLLLGSISPPS